MALVLGWFVSFGGKALTDQLSYYQFYKSVDNISLSSTFQLLFEHYQTIENRNTFEAGYVFINVLFSKLGFGYVGFIFIYSVVMNYFLFLAFSENKHLGLITAVFLTTSLFVQQANLIRQMMAVSMFVYGVKYIQTREFVKYLLIIVLCSTLHMSALILIPFYFFANKHIPKYIIIIIYILSVYSNLAKIELEFLNSYIFLYYDMSFEKFGREEEEIFNIALNLFFILSLILYNKKSITSDKDKLYFNLFFIGIVLSNLMFVSFGLYRISLYFTIFSVIIIAQIPKYFSHSTLVKKISLYKFKVVIYSIIALYYFRILYRRVMNVDTHTLGSEFYSMLDFF